MTGQEEALLVEASAWLDRARHGDEADRAAFRLWLKARPEHVAAMDAVTRAWELAPAAVRAAAPVARPAGNSARAWRWPTLLAPAAAGALACAALAFMWIASLQTHLYAAPADRAVQVRLADGSTAWLAPHARLAVYMTPLDRSATLTGEAAFDVAHERRGFTVLAGSVQTVDLGTVFAIKADGPRVSVTLESGSIDVRDAKTGAVIAAPVPGQRVDVTPAGAQIVAVDVAQELAWRDGRLIVRDQPLSAVLARFAELGAPRVTIADPALGAVRVSGSYRADAIEQFLDALAMLHPVSWRHRGEGYEVRSR